MNNPHTALIEKWYKDLPAIIVPPDVSWTVTPEELLALIDTVSMIVREEEAVEYNKIIERAVAAERQFILNILDGIDIADEEMGNNGGGTKAIRSALKSRIITTLPDKE